MESKVYAAIDIGTNSARLLIKNIRENTDGKLTVKKLMFLRFPLRLGDDVFISGVIGPEKEEKMLRMINGFKQFMRIYNVDSYLAYATSAMRGAKNGASIIEMIERETEIKIKIIDEKEEANIIYENRIEPLIQGMQTCAYVDVGGGSTEISIIRDSVLQCSTSYKIGTIRMLHNTDKENAAAIKKMKSELLNLCEDFTGINIIGSGGNINKLYHLVTDKNKINTAMLSISNLKKIYNKLKALTIEERMDEYSLKKDRADVIVPAAEIFLTVASAFKSKYIYVPVLGLVDGMIYQLYKEEKKV